MGDRGNIAIRHPEGEDTIYLYTHWAGSAVPSVLAEGLRKSKEAGRLTDPPYATRIIFDTLTGGIGSSTGFGISIGSPPDNEHEIPYVVWENFGDEPIVHFACGRFTAESWITAFGETTSDEVSI